MKRVLVCGGAGYIGAHMAKRLAESGNDVVVFDNLSTGHRAAVQWGELIEGDLRDEGALERVFASRTFDAVMHFCAKSLVAESVRDPVSYYDNNFNGTVRLLSAMRNAGVGHLVFSSTAAVYGTPISDFIEEAHQTLPINPYGASKLFSERLLQDAADAYGLRSVALRYFNAAGADPSGDIGESHSPETHLVPNAIRSALGHGGALDIYGTDYPTADGTCVRDYVHVNDLADAHLRALRHLDAYEGAYRFNLGSNAGFSVREVIASVSAVAGREVPVRICDRRAGDPPALVANSDLARRVLGWEPVYSRLEDIIATAYRWHVAPRY